MFTFTNITFVRKKIKNFVIFFLFIGAFYVTVKYFLEKYITAHALYLWYIVPYTSEIIVRGLYWHYATMYIEYVIYKFV